jgi:HlyD family secretion protein
VVTYGTIIEVKNPELKLKPGMTATVSIIVARRDDALKIPNSALRFRPPASLPSKKGNLFSGSSESVAGNTKTSTEQARKKEKHKTDRVVYVLRNTSLAGDSLAKAVTLEPVQIRTGINDARYVEVLAGLNEGEEVATGLGASKGGLSQTFNPFSNAKRH